MRPVRYLLLWAIWTAVVVPACAEEDTVRIGVLTDMSGIFSDWSGRGSVVAAQLAVDDFKAAHAGFQAEVTVADHQNKPDVAASIARRCRAVAHARSRSPVRSSV